MIVVTNIHKKKFVINSDLIERIESTPDTNLILTTGKEFIVCESFEEIIQKTVEFKKSILQDISK